MFLMHWEQLYLKAMWGLSKWFQKKSYLYIFLIVIHGYNKIINANIGCLKMLFLSFPVGSFKTGLIYST